MESCLLLNVATACLSTFPSSLRTCERAASLSSARLIRAPRERMSSSMMEEASSRLVRLAKSVFMRHRTPRMKGEEAKMSQARGLLFERLIVRRSTRRRVERLEEESAREMIVEAWGVSRFKAFDVQMLGAVDALPIELDSRAENTRSSSCAWLDDGKKSSRTESRLAIDFSCRRTSSLPNSRIFLINRSIVVRLTSRGENSREL